MPVFQPLAIALTTLLLLGPTREQVKIVGEPITIDTQCYVSKETILFRDARTEIKGKDRTYDVMVTPAGTDYGTSNTLTLGNLDYDETGSPAHDCFGLTQGCIIVRINPETEDTEKREILTPSADWPVVRVEMIDAGAEGTTFGVVRWTDAGGVGHANIMLLEGTSIWADLHENIEKGTAPNYKVVDADKEDKYISVTFPKDAEPTIEIKEYDPATTTKFRDALIAKAKNWSASKSDP